jgi:medium-chain acyl-[acyl-carrier-protein] hydrolase
MRLYTFAHAGASARTFASWAKLLGPQTAVVGVEFPGHGGRVLEEALREVNGMAREAASAIEMDISKTEHHQIALYGHSLGAIVAYETARLLEDGATEVRCSMPTHLFVGAMRAPHLPRTTTSIAHLEQAKFLAAIQQRFGGIPQAVLSEPELLEVIMPALRGDFIAYEDYKYEAGHKLRCPVTAFAGKLDPIVPESTVAEWADHTTGPFHMHTMVGDHFFLLECRDQVLDILSRSLQFDLPVPSVFPARHAL